MRQAPPLTGMRKASVLPEPVLAAPSTSRPHSAWGSAARWMAVRVTNLASFSASLVYPERGRSSNLRAAANEARPGSATAASGLLPRGGACSAITASNCLISTSSACERLRRFW